MADEMKFEVNLEGFELLIRKLEAATKKEVIFDTLKQGGYLLQSWSQKNRLTGPRPVYLGVVTNRLRSSIAVGNVEQSGNGYVVKIGTNVEYAPIHEFGGFTGRRRKVLMPARPFLRPALSDEKNQAEILNILTENINSALEKTK